MKPRLLFAAQVSIVATCALVLGVKVADAIRIIEGWFLRPSGGMTGYTSAATTEKGQSE